MILANKQLGETPLELLERIRREQPELFGANGEAAGVKLSYAGRLDPMAEGQTIILVGDEENAPENRAKFLGLDKEYVATFLVGVKTDTGDCLGLITDTGAKWDGEAPEALFKAPSKELITRQIENLKQITEQTYPWFSGKAVDGIKLFDHFKAGKTDSDFERPSQKVEIKEVELLGFAEQDSAQIKKYIFDAIGKVTGDFRQKEILAKWNEFFSQTSSTHTFQIFEIKIVVSSGTYIRALTEHFDFPVMLLKLNRTAIIGL